MRHGFVSRSAVCGAGRGRRRSCTAPAPSRCVASIRCLRRRAGRPDRCVADSCRARRCVARVAAASAPAPLLHHHDAWHRYAACVGGPEGPTDASRIRVALGGVWRGSRPPPLLQPRVARFRSTSCRVGGPEGPTDASRIRVALGGVWRGSRLPPLLQPRVARFRSTSCRVGGPEGPTVASRVRVALGGVWRGSRLPPLLHRSCTITLRGIDTLLAQEGRKARLPRHSCVAPGRGFRRSYNHALPGSAPRRAG